MESSERLRLEIVSEGGTLSVLMQPLLKTAPPHLDDARQPLRAALAHPLSLHGTPDRLDRAWPEALRTYAQQRQTLQATVSELDTLGDAIRRAQQAVQTRQQQAAQKTKKARGSGHPPQEDAAQDQTEEDTPEGEADTQKASTPPVATTNPDSLF